MNGPLKGLPGCSVSCMLTYLVALHVGVAHVDLQVGVLLEVAGAQVCLVAHGVHVARLVLCYLVPFTCDSVSGLLISRSLDLSLNELIQST